MTTATQAEPRRRDASDSRARLLDAAARLFAELGYDRTTLRAIGQQAGIDPALIARYFGGKSGLYLAALRQGEPVLSASLDLSDPAEVEQLIVRLRAKEPTPTLWAVVRPHDDAELQVAAMGFLGQRMLDGSIATAQDNGADNARLRGQILVAALAGVLLSRTAGTFDALAGAEPADIAHILSGVVSAVLTPAEA